MQRSSVALIISKNLCNKVPRDATQNNMKPTESSKERYGWKIYTYHLTCIFDLTIKAAETNSTGYNSMINSSEWKFILSSWARTQQWLWSEETLSNDDVNYLPETSHWIGFSPVWMPSCLDTSPEAVHWLLQYWHSKERSPAWSCQMYLIKCLNRLNFLP